MSFTEYMRELKSDIDQAVETLMPPVEEVKKDCNEDITISSIKDGLQDAVAKQEIENTVKAKRDVMEDNRSKTETMIMLLVFIAFILGFYVGYKLF